MGTRPQPQSNKSYDRRSSYENANGNRNQFNNDSRSTSFSSQPNTEENCNGNSNSNANGSSEYDNKYQKRSNNTGSMPLHLFLVWRVLPCLVLILLPWIPNQFVRNQIRTKKLAIETIIQEQKDRVESLDETTQKIKEIKQEIESLHKDNELSFQELKQNGKTPENLAAGDEGIAGVSSITDMESEEYAALEVEEEVLVNRIDRLEKSIQQSAVKRLGDRCVHACMYVCMCWVWNDILPRDLCALSLPISSRFSGLV